MLNVSSCDCQYLHRRVNQLNGVFFISKVNGTICA